MSRWCRSTIRILDGRGKELASSLRFRSLATKVRAGLVYRADADTRQKDTTESASRCLNLATPAAPFPSTTRTVNRRRQVSLTRHSQVTGVGRVPIASSSNLSGASTPCTLLSTISEQLPHAVTERSVVITLERGVGSAETTHQALDALEAFLSPTRRPLKMTVELLDSLYLAAKERQGLHCLTSRQLTQLLSLFGTLSLAQPNPSAYDSTRLRYTAGLSGKVDRWSVVLEIAEAKEKLGQELVDKDRYWIMQAWIAKANSATSSASGKSWRENIDKATAQYHIISRSASDPEAHIPYFESFLSRPGFAHMKQIVDALCHVLESQLNPHPRIPEFLFTFLLKHGHRLSLPLKERILGIVSTRVSKPPYQAPQSSSATPPLAGDTQGKNLVLDAPLGTAQLCSALSAAIFPCYSPRFPVSFVARWARKEARAAFASELDVNVRWSNLLLLAVCNLPHVSVESSKTPMELLSDGVFLDWQTTLILRALETTPDDNGVTPSAVHHHARGISRSLWRLWRKTDGQRRPVDISRVLVASFLRIAARTADGPLKEECFQYCVGHNLRDYRDDNTVAMKLQVQDLTMAHALASIACRSESWSEIFRGLNHADAKAKEAIMEALLLHFASRDVEMAHSLYLFNESAKLSQSSHTLLALSKSLARSYKWKLVTPFFSDPRLSRDQVEELLGYVLRIFQIQRREYAEPAIAALLGDIMLRLYAQTSPSLSFKFPIRYFFSVMISSRHPSKAVDIMEAIHRTTPAFFTLRFFLRILRALLRRREPSLAVRLFRLISYDKPSSRSMSDTRRKLTLGLAATGAHTLARTVHHMGTPRGGLRTSRECLVRVVGFRTRSPARHLVGDILSIAKRAETDGPSIRYAVSLLIKARRTLAARKLFERTFRHLDAETRTAIGNILLHGPLRRLDERNGRLVRHILRTKEFLVKNYEFVPDRTTVNIILKSLLKWRHFFDSPRLKALFDRMIREGYPASKRWLGQYSVPFGTSASSSSKTFAMIPVSPYISFEKHVRPMYKMFTKAFYLCGDVRAARKVIGIMREEEVIAVREREKRNRARRLGIVKKKMKALGQFNAENCT